MCSSEKAQGFHWTLRAAASLQSITIEDGSSVWQTSQQFTNRAFRGYVHGNLHNEDCIFNRFRWLRRQLRLHRLRPCLIMAQPIVGLAGRYWTQEPSC